MTILITLTILWHISRPINKKQVVNSIKIFALIAVVIGSCSKPAPTPAPLFAAHIFYKSSSGDDLLNPQTSGGINGSNVKVYDLISNNGSQTEQPAKIDETACGNYVCGPDNNGHYYVQFLFRPSLDNLGEIIQLTSTAADTLLYQIGSASPQAGYVVKEVTYRGNAVWSRGAPTPASITIER